MREIRNNGCEEERVVMRQVVGALLAPDDSEDAKQIELYLLYPVTAGSKGVYVVVDPMNEIVESNEEDNVKPVPEELESSSPLLDVAREVVGKTALPFAVIVLTIALLGVVYLVGKGRRDEVNKRLAEQSSLVSVLADEAEQLSSAESLGPRSKVPAQLGVQRGCDDLAGTTCDLLFEPRSQRVDDVSDIGVSRELLLNERREVNSVPGCFNHCLDETAVLVGFKVGLHSCRNSLTDVLMQRDEGVSLGVQLLEDRGERTHVSQPFGHGDFFPTAERFRNGNRGRREG